MKAKTPVILWPLVAAALLLAGCATVEPEQFTALQSQVYQQQRQIAELKGRVDTLSQQAKRARKPRAEMVAEVSSLRQEIMRLSGRVEESEHQMGQAMSAKTSAEQAQAQAETAKVAELNKRLARLEAYLGMKPGSGKPPANAPVSAKAKAASAAPQPKDIYNLGLRLYRQKSYSAARDRFTEYVKKYPKSNLADNAQYWAGETYYAQKKYEEAILAYNHMIKHYPKSSKVPAALLKQGLAFRALGDKRTAKIVLKKLVKRYPKTSQAKLAKKVLKKL
ncbi:MAG: tol-pal system protein YbgF [Desulfarculaceae bacterium]|nr:tol-pal system protein YbgF [Desulfarculaceae bacterium]MCF8074274.1 tol-pal system protein YbgF [Desulfarculaceae bacterium]MCF8102967.1 tol-pal system protein YbgF [Desulfarculaceae bacterium]MCF8117098.1 tol-pal system protein YbgF [Desulfarculaceae bacterium]